MGVAIVVDGVNWSKNAVAQVTITGSGGISETVQTMYDAYLAKSGRTGNDYLLELMNELYKSGLLQKCTGLFYFASDVNNLSHAKYNIIDGRALTVGGSPTVSVNGLNSNAGVGLGDGGKYDLVTKGLACVFMIPVTTPSNGIDWGGDFGDSTNTFFSSFGSYQYGSGIITWMKKSVISTAHDTQDKKGLFVWYAKGTKGRYIHGEVDMQATLTAHTKTNVNPRLFSFSDTGSFPSAATIKMYATFNNDLSDDEVTQINLIFNKYQDYL